MGLSAVLLPQASAGITEGPAVPGGAVDSRTTATFERVADAVLTDRTSALLDRPAARRGALTLDKGIRLASGLARAEANGLATLKGRKARLASLGEAYTAADTKVAVDSVRISDGQAVVRVTETTTLTYKKIRGDEPATTGFQAHHEMRFAPGAGGGWDLAGIESEDRGIAAVNQPDTAARAGATTPPRGTPAATTRPAPSAPKTQTATGYDYRAMAAYAERYWSNYNPAYRKFNDAGGDCTNFTSQALKAGGWKHAPGDGTDYRTWWYGSTTQSTSWVGADEWSWFTLSSKRATNLKNAYQLGVGDIMQMDFNRDGSKDHSMMATYRSSSGMPYLTYHSVNTYRKSLASIIASYPNAVYYAYRT